MNAYRPLIVCLLGTFALALSHVTAYAQSEPPTADPAAIAERCVTLITDRADRAVAHLGDHATRTVAKIDELVEAGQPRKAVALARRAAKHINRDAARAAKSIVTPTHRCVHVLRAMGEVELAEEVAAAGREQVNRVNDARSRAIDAIKQALPNDAGDVE